MGIVRSAGRSDLLPLLKHFINRFWIEVSTTATLLERTALYQQRVLPPHPSYPRKRVSRVSCENRNPVLNCSLLSQGRSLDSRFHRNDAEKSL